MATTSTKVLKVICRNRRKVRNTRNQATFNLATRWIPFYINPPRAVISPTNDPRDLLFARCFVATGGEASTRFLLDQREREREMGVFWYLGSRYKYTFAHNVCCVLYFSSFGAKTDIVEVNLSIKKIKTS